MSSTPLRPSFPLSTRLRRSSLVVAALLAGCLLAGCLRPGVQHAYRALTVDRHELGLRALPVHDAAQRKAQRWADHLAATGTLDHSELTDGFAGVRWCSIGENIGYGPDPQAIEDAYMESPRHRANIASTKWNHVGVGYATSGPRVYTVQVFLKTC